MKEIEVSGHDDYKRLVEALETQRALSHDHLLSLLEFSSANEVTSEGVRRKLVSFFDYSTHKLRDEIEVRTVEDRPFEETEMWSIVCSPTLGLSYLQKQNIGHGCVSVIDIFLTPEGLIKINDPAISSSSPFSFVEGYYYAPELLESLSSLDPSLIDSLDIFRADVFSLGMCALAAGLLEDCTDCYIYEQGLIDEEMLRSKLRRLAQVYSENYVRIIEAMLDFNISQRPDFIQLEECLVELLSDFSDNSSQPQTSMTTMKSVRFLSRPTPTIEESEPDLEDNGDFLNIKDICPDSSHEEEVTDVNEDTKTPEEEVQTKSLLKSASKSMLGNRNEVSMNRSTIYDFDKMQEEDSSNYWSQPRLSGFSSVSRDLKSSQQADFPKSRKTLNVDYREGISKENMNISNLNQKACKSIVIDSDIPILSSRMSHAFLKQDLKMSVKSSIRENSCDRRTSESQLFTDPVLMEIVRTDLKRIQSKPKVTFIYPF